MEKEKLLTVSFENVKQKIKDHTNVLHKVFPRIIDLIGISKISKIGRKKRK